MTVDLYSRRIRQSLIREKLRTLRLGRPLLCDSLYDRGELGDQQWRQLHAFRNDREALVEARAKGRKLTAGNGKPGFTITPLEIRMALLCEREMSVETFDWALVLIGERQGHVEPEQARRTAWELGEVYAGRHKDVRWKDGKVSCQ